MKTIRVNVSAEDIAAAGDLRKGVGWWQWPVRRALEGLTGVDVDIDGGDGDNCIATIGGKEDTTLVVELPTEASAWLDLRWHEKVPGEPFFFELSLPDWLVALVTR